jgi:hypothetical protein
MPGMVPGAKTERSLYVRPRTQPARKWTSLSEIITLHSLMRSRGEAPGWCRCTIASLPRLGS